MPAATRVRARVLGFAFLLAVVTYLDRVCISAAAPYIMNDLHLTVLQMSVVFSAFTLAYSLFEIPSGWLGDVRGPRRVLTRIVLWWSAFTMLTAAARGYYSLVAIRFLFGAGEAGAFPNIARSFSRWFPTRERGRANGVMFLGSRVGGMLSAPIALLIVSRWGWRASFVVFGTLGVVWAATWFAWYRDRPEEHPDVNEKEIAWIQQDAAASGDRPADELALHEDVGRPFPPSRNASADRRSLGGGGQGRPGAERYRALLALRESPHTHAVYPFGETLHYADARRDLAPERIGAEVAAFLASRGFADARVEPTPPTVEDSFIARMGAPDAERAA